MPTVNLIQDTRRKRKDGTYPICFMIRNGYQWTTIPTSFSVSEDEWNADVRLIDAKKCKRYKRVRNININLHVMLENYRLALDELKEKHGRAILNMKPKDIREKLLKDAEKDYTFHEFTTTLINEMKKNKQFGNARIYKDTRDFVFRVHGSRTLPFEYLDYNFMVKAENYYRRRNDSLAGFNVYARTIRAIFNKAIRAGVAQKKWYPFEDYKIKKPKKKRLIGISREEIKRIEAYETRPGTVAALAKDVFLFSFYMRGMNLADIAKLTKRNIVGNRIEYVRSKQKGEFSIPIHPKAAAILKKYEGKGNFGYLFPIRKHKNPEDAYRDERTKLRGINGKIHKMAKDLGITVNLTTYSARHSFAQIAKSKGASTESIKDALGHENYAVTEHYLTRFSDDALDEMFNGIYDDQDED